MTCGERGWPAPIFEATHVKKIRLKEAHIMSERIGVFAYFMKSSDTGVFYSKTLCLKLVSIIRSLKPDSIITHFFGERHPDHRNTSILTLDASYYAGIAGICPKISPHYVSSEYIFASQNESNLTFGIPFRIHVDVSDVFEEAIEVLKIYKSQYRNYEVMIRKKATELGSSLGVKFAEAFIPVKMSQPMRELPSTKLFDTLPT